EHARGSGGRGRPHRRPHGPPRAGLERRAARGVEPPGAAMSPATWPRDNPLEERLLRVDPRAERFLDARVADLPSMLREGDLLVVNDGATLPASLRGMTVTGA